MKMKIPRGQRYENDMKGMKNGIKVRGGKDF